MDECCPVKSRNRPLRDPYRPAARRGKYDNETNICTAIYILENVTKCKQGDIDSYILVL